MDLHIPLLLSSPTHAACVALAQRYQRSQPACCAKSQSCTVDTLLWHDFCTGAVPESKPKPVQSATQQQSQVTSAQQQPVESRLFIQRHQRSWGPVSAQQLERAQPSWKRPEGPWQGLAGTQAAQEAGPQQQLYPQLPGSSRWVVLLSSRVSEGIPQVLQLIPSSKRLQPSC
jgi:hypothetical protein